MNTILHARTALAISRLVCACAGLLCISAVEAQLVAPQQASSLVADAIALEHGEGVAKDVVKAMAIYCDAARLGDAQAQFNLGWIYANGRGVVRDDGIAAQLFQMAANSGHPQAANMLRLVGAPASKVLDCLRENPVADATATIILDEKDELLAGASAERKVIVDLVFRLAPEYQVNPKLALAVITAESAYNVYARSPKNAQGLMQLIPETAARFNVKNAFDPVQNIRGGLAYLRWLLAYFRGDVTLVAAGYNAGEGAVDKYRGVPPYRETQGYVKSIISLFKNLEHPYDSSVVDASPLISRRVNAQVHAR